MKRSSALMAAFVLLILTISPIFSKTVVFLHSNDTHGIYKPYKFKTEEGEEWVGGMEAVCHYLNAIREKEKNVLYIETGDIMTGTIATELIHKNVTGGFMIEFLNILGCDLWCFGNHDFDLGSDNALGLAGLADFPTVMSNIVYKETRQLIPVKPYHIFDKDGLRVGVTAVMSERFLIEVLKERIADLDVMPVVPALRSSIPDLDKKSDLIVVLVHGRFFEAIDVAKNVPGIDIILVASEDGQFEVVNDVLIQSTRGHQKTLGYLKVEVQDDGVSDYEENQIWLWANDQLRPSPEIMALVKEVDETVGSEYAKVIGKAERDHFQDGESVENALGNWITDAMRWKTGVDIGFQNSGGIRADILTGPITKGDIFEVSPFRNTLVLFDLTGSMIKELLEHDVEKDWDRLQISGMCYSYHPKDSKPMGERIIDVTIEGDALVKNGKLLHPDKVYTVVSNNYLVSQAKDKYFGFSVEKSQDTGVLINQVMISWLEKYKLLDYKIEGRIIKIDN